MLNHNRRRSVHILHIAESFGAGTLAVLSSLLSLGADLGWSATVFRGNRSESPRDCSAIFPSNTTVVQLRTGRSVNGLLDLHDALRIAHYAHAKKVDGIHAHSSKAGALGRIAGLISGVPVIYTPHGFAFMAECGPNHRCFSYWAESLLGRLPGTFACCSESEAVAARQFSKSVVTVPNCVDKKALEKSIRGVRSRSFDIVGMGRVCAQKNISLFLQIARQLPDNTFVWVGGPVSDIHECLPPNVTVTGWVDRQNALALISKSRVFLLTSRFEGMPISVLEAMALDVPIVSTDVVGATDLVRHEFSGLLGHSEQDLCAAVRRLLTDENLREFCVANAERLLAVEYDPTAIRRRWLDVYSLHFGRDISGFEQHAAHA